MTEMRRPDAHENEAAADGPIDPMARMSELLMMQVFSLDAMYGELAGHFAKTFTEWPGTAERYARLAMRAQANCRASVETIARTDRVRRQAQGDTAE